MPNSASLGHVVDLLAHLVERGVDPLALGLDVLGDGMLDDDARLVEHRLAPGHAVDQLEPGQPQRPGAAQPAAARAVDQPALAIISDSTIATVCSASISTSS